MVGSFPDYSVDHLVHLFSDHCLILVATKSLYANRHGKDGRNFKFNVDWCLDKECENLIHDYWMSTVESLQKN